MTRGTFWCLPDDYEIDATNEASLQDIRLALHPTFTKDQVRQLDTQKELVRDLFGRRYLPGYVGLNNLNKTDYLNCVVQALGHVRPLRDFFLLAPNNYENINTVVSGNDERNDVALNNNGKRKMSTTATTTLPYEEFSPIAKSFSLLLRNMWSPHRFKSNVDPHMLVQAVSVASNKRYHVGQQAEAGEFLAWFLHQLHLGVGGSNHVKVSSKKKKKIKNKNKNKMGSSKGGGGSIIHETFMGNVEITTVVTRRKRRGEEAALAMLNEGGRDASKNGKNNNSSDDADVDAFDDEEDDRAGSDDEETMERKRQKREILKSLADEIIIDEEESVTETQFLQLTLDIPEKPLFKDDDGGLVIPQEPLVNVLRKFDGVSFSDVLAMHQQTTESNTDGTIISKKRRYKLKTLPNYLILHLSRFKRNGFFVEKNPTIVMFPVKNFDLSSYVFPEGGRKEVPTEDQVRAMSTKEMKNLLVEYGRGDVANNAIEKKELLQHCLDFVSSSLPDLLADKYDLVANITHDIPAEVGREGTKHNPLEEGSYRCHVQHKALGKWYEMQDLEVTETMPQLIGVSESYLLIFERKGAVSST